MRGPRATTTTSSPHLTGASATSSLPGCIVGVWGPSLLPEEL